MSKKTQNGQRKSLLTGASVLAAAAAAMTAAPAMAQDTEDEEAIVVTGTRLARQDFEAISPITTVGSEQLELTATLTTDSLLNELPQIIPGNTRTSNNAGGEDFATVDLRGLGANRTLVLINGERVPASSTTGTVDLNTIPASLISRIEVVTGGASAVYGSDAMSGVVNFVLKDDYEGGEVTLTYGAEMETGNAAEFEMNGLVGGNFANGRGNITVYGSYYNRESVLQSEYDYSRISAAFCYDGAGTYFVCDNRAEAVGFNVFPGGSGTPPWGIVTNNPLNPFAGLSAIPILTPRFGAGTYDRNCDGVPNAAGYNTGNLSFNDAGQLTPPNNQGFCGIPDRSIGSSRYNFAPDNFLVIPAERAAFTANGHYDISDDVTLNFLFNYTDSHTEVQLAPTPAAGATNITINLTPGPDGSQAYIAANHPDLWAALQSRANPLAPFRMDRRFSELGTRVGISDNTSYLLMTSLEGSLGESWDWNLGMSYGDVRFMNRTLNNLSKAAVHNGVAGCVDSAGNPLPEASALGNCVLVDIYGPGTITPAMAEYIGFTAFSIASIEESRITGYVRGDLFELPAGPVATVFGFEYRDSYLAVDYDARTKSGDIIGFNGQQAQEGQVDVYELYTEVAVPLVSEAPFAHYLGLEGGFRRSNYSTVGNVDTYKIGGEWAPTEWLRFRAVFNEATRAPSVFELFLNGDQGFPSYTDPCKDTNGDGIPNNAAVSAALCAAGIPTYGVLPFSQVNSQAQVFSFGNPNLTPETAETMTYGFVLQPDWFPIGDFRATVDYYDIEITDVIAPFGIGFYLTGCYINLDPAACARITRDADTGQIFAVDLSSANQASFTTEGYDIQLEWSLPLGPGQLTINELYSITESFQFNGAEFVGITSAGIGGAIPDYKSVLSVTYNVGDWTVFGRWSYVPEMGDGAFGTAVMSPAASYVDVSARWNVTDNFTLTANIDNIADEIAPQTIPGLFSQANTDPQVYRVLGRTFAISGRYRF